MFLEHVKLLCFGASYSAALASELAGSFIPSMLRRALSLGFTLAGIVAHTAYLVQRSAEAGICPLTTSYDSLLVLAWVLGVTYLSVHWYFPRVSLGIFALPVIIGLIAAA